MSRSWRPLISSSVSPSCRTSGEAFGRCRATSRSALVSVKGVRSSWEAFAMNRRCPSKEWSSRSSMTLKVSASSPSSSRGPSSLMRSCRPRSAAGASAIRPAVSVMRWSGCSMRPATR